MLVNAGAGPGSVLDQCRRVRVCGSLNDTIQGQTWPVVDSKSAIKLAGQGCLIRRGLSPECVGIPECRFRIWLSAPLASSRARPVPRLTAAERLRDLC